MIKVIIIFLCIWVCSTHFLAGMLPEKRLLEDNNAKQSESKKQHLESENKKSLGVAVEVPVKLSWWQNAIQLVKSKMRTKEQYDGVCLFARLPKDIQDYIAEKYLIFRDRETDEDFLARVNKGEKKPIRFRGFHYTGWLTGERYVINAVREPTSNGTAFRDKELNVDLQSHLIRDNMLVNCSVDGSKALILQDRLTDKSGLIERKVTYFDFVKGESHVHYCKNKGNIYSTAISNDGSKFCYVYRAPEERLYIASFDGSMKADIALITEKHNTVLCGYPIPDFSKSGTDFELSNELNFNKQGTMIAARWFRWKENDTVIITIADFSDDHKAKTKKTLDAYFRLHGICKNLSEQKK